MTETQVTELNRLIQEKDIFIQSLATENTPKAPSEPSIPLLGESIDDRVSAHEMTQNKEFYENLLNQEKENYQFFKTDSESKAQQIENMERQINILEEK
jgi:Mg2+ and Co2+ transporter CorA